MLFVI